MSERENLISDNPELEELVKLQDTKIGVVRGSSLLTVTIVSGSDLIPADKNGLADPYVLVSMPGLTGGIKSDRKDKTLNPEFDATFHFNYNRRFADGDKIKFEVWDFDKMTKDDFMGVASLSLSKLSAEPLEVDLSLEGREGKNDKVTGSIKVVATMVEGDDLKDAVEGLDPIVVAWEKEAYVNPSYVNIFGASHDGYLYKQPTNSQLDSGKKWEKRYMAINGKILYYFADQTQHDTKGFVQIHEDSVRIDDVDDHSDRGNCIYIFTDFVTLNLSADSAEDKQAWISALKAENKK